MNIKKLVKKLTPSFLMDWYHLGWAFAGALVFGFPSRKLTVIGVTGTSGKSTTIDFITRILEESGAKVASTSSVRFKVADKEWKNTMKMTMPGRFVIQKVLAQAVKAGCKYAVLEVTSEGIRQHRHEFIQFNTAVFLNLTPEHIESHGSFENYRNEKLKLFNITRGMHVINVDDAQSEYFLKFPAAKKYCYGVENQQADVQAKNIDVKNGALKFSVNNVEFSLNVLGNFNVLNALAAISVGLSENIPLDVCKKALRKVTGMPGRLEVVAKEPFWAVIDYAFTPEQLEASYKSLNSRPLVCVLGACGGGRDSWKRPVLGKIAQQYCREIIVTNEDPYDEDPMQIINQVAEGAGPKAQKILDRKEAIQKALSLTKQGETCIITGKGSEPLMVLANGKKIPWSDKNIVLEELAKIDSSIRNTYN
ncbi:UDP-N-acetylmuramoyl-L-alanyl-D-glutamate--2,6-diaminopimelate ligase [Candidatus Parcubacteria bacterium]|nr:UDP-N-acetylmuramoyl-L-alanyl-D-glutamate--2,6-diaminopimelate ligase [Candidatus Parcubacteria bacterium]